MINIHNSELLEELRDRLRFQHHRLVLAESCTAGYVAAMIGAVPGISEVFCGSMVVYQNRTKVAWLQVEGELLENPNIGPVSEEVTRILSDRILKSQPQATIGAAITGHLGPMPPNSDQSRLDGVVFTSVTASRNKTDAEVMMPHNNSTNNFELHELFDKPRSPSCCVIKHRLELPAPADSNHFIGRQRRQEEAAIMLLKHIIQVLRELEGV